LLTLFSIWTVVFLIAAFIVPKATKEFSSLASINPQTVIDKFSEPIATAQRIYRKINPNFHETLTVNELIQQKIVNALNHEKILSGLRQFSSMIGNIVVTIFSISFIAFFLLRDPTLPLRVLVMIFPDSAKTKLLSTYQQIELLLQRYFLGLMLQVLIIFSLLFIGLLFTQLKTNQILLIAMVGALLNVIPYIGPILGLLFGMLITALLGAQMLEFPQIVNQLILCASIFIITQIIDNVFLQTLIFSKTVKAHPLEIFFVISMAGYVWGIPAMIIAIPIYTSLKVIVITFFPDTEWSKKISKQITENL